MGTGGILLTRLAGVEIRYLVRMVRVERTAPESQAPCATDTPHPDIGKETGAYTRHP